MIIEDKGHASIDDPKEEIPSTTWEGQAEGQGEGKGKGIGMGKGSTDTKNLRRRSYLKYQG